MFSSLGPDVRGVTCGGVEEHRGGASALALEVESLVEANVVEIICNNMWNLVKLYLQSDHGGLTIDTRFR